MALSPAKSTPDKELYRALDKHRMAMFILTQKDRPIPSFQEMQADLSKDDLQSIKERIATAKSDHKQDLERLYTAHAEDYLDDQRLRRESREDYGGGGNSSAAAASSSSNGSAGGGGQADNRLAEWSEKRDPLTSTDHHYFHSLSHDLAITRLQHTQHIHTLDLLHKKLVTQADEDRRKRDAQFPLSVEEFKAKPRDIQIRVATFLAAEGGTGSAGAGGKREKMMSEFGWAWRQTENLVRAYTKDEEFRKEVGRLVETFLESKDPRRKPTQ